MGQSAILSESPSVVALANPASPIWRSLLGPWLLALSLSALLVLAGWRWPTPLLQQVWAQVDPGRPALLALLLVLFEVLVHWPRVLAVQCPRELVP